MESHLHMNSAGSVSLNLEKKLKGDWTEYLPAVGWIEFWVNYHQPNKTTSEYQGMGGRLRREWDYAQEHDLPKKFPFNPLYAAAYGIYQAATLVWLMSSFSG